MTGEYYKAIVIGAGPAGLAVSALLQQRGVEHVVLEARGQVGGTYSRLWPGLKLLSPPSMSHLPLQRCAHAGRQIRAGEYAEYLRYYAQCLPVRLRAAVVRVVPEQDGYGVELSDQTRLKAKYVIAATGMSDFPHRLPPAQVGGVTVPVLDAVQFNGPAEYAGKNVLVVGSGTSAYEIAALLAESANVWLATRGLRRCVPLFIAGINFHYLVRFIELLPLRFLKKVCSPSWREPPISIGIERMVQRGRIQIIDPRCRVIRDQLQFRDGRAAQIDLIFNATGYDHRMDYLPANIARTERGDVATLQNQSCSHPGLFLMGSPCSGGIDSQFLRGVRRDARRIAMKI